MNPSAIDFEISTIPQQYLCTFLEMITVELESRQNFELVQVYLNLFLKRQGESLIKTPTAIEQAQRLLEKLQEAWPHLENSHQKSICLIKYFSGLQL